MRGRESLSGPRIILHGLPWVVWRRHRATLLAGLVITVVGGALFAYQRIGVMDFVNLTRS